MAKKIFSFICFVLLCLSITACAKSGPEEERSKPKIVGSGIPVQQGRSVQPINRIEILGAGQAQIVVGSDMALAIEAEDNLLPLIESGVEGEILYIWLPKDIQINPTLPIRYVIQVPSLKELVVRGQIQAVVNPVEANRLVLSAEGNSSIQINHLKTIELHAILSGSAQMDIRGNAAQQVIDISDNAQFFGDQLTKSTGQAGITQINQRQ